MVRLIKLKFAININLTTLDVTYNPNKHNWLEKTKKKRSYFKEKTTFEMQRREFQFTVLTCIFYRNLLLTI